VSTSVPVDPHEGDVFAFASSRVQAELGKGWRLDKVVLQLKRPDGRRCQVDLDQADYLAWTTLARPLHPR
jgi:hypothetical protein